MDEDLPGDILVFLSGQEEIDSAKSILESRVKKLLSSGVKMLKLIVRPLYAALPPQEQLLAIEPLPVGQRHNTRKVRCIESQRAKKFWAWLSRRGRMGKKRRWRN